jgi:hypothetical protein
MIENNIEKSSRKKREKEIHVLWLKNKQIF